MWMLLSPGIARRSGVLRRNCSVNEEHDDLGTYRTHEDVTTVRHDTVNKKKKKGRKEASWLRREMTSTASGSGGLRGSCEGGLVAWRGWGWGQMVGAEQGYK